MTSSAVRGLAGCRYQDPGKAMGRLCSLEARLNQDGWRTKKVCILLAMERRTPYLCFILFTVDIFSLSRNVYIQWMHLKAVPYAKRWF